VPRLRRSDCSHPGLTRRRRGRDFEILDAEGERVDDEATLERIRDLAIPPAWKDVWICLDERGHLQATGTDAAGRKQYRYHDEWRTRRDAAKFDDMLDFAEALPMMRRRVTRDLRSSDGLTRERVLACAVRLLDLGFFRIGSEDYAEQNESYGLATLRREHVTVKADELVFEYPAKGGQRRRHPIKDDDVRAIVTRLKRRRGGESEELLGYREGRAWRDLKATDVNEYLKAVLGGEASAKDFRTWNATVLAAIALATADPAASKTARKRVVNQAVKAVAMYLGNTPAVARASYIDPRVFDRYRSGWTIAGAIHDPDALTFANERVRRGLEAGVLDLLADERASPALEQIAA